ncbi:down syndrome cell adhesion molecule [Nephila pilipes]|uniref:Down syndrome cell adhesion molecule n=1 Tax=Nephila pilipes TaxID=299642 RepID=A0A8X6UFE3_NEPPI|nr:down syndrome cell adhesion molecule [Nephila pilipes]
MPSKLCPAPDSRCPSLLASQMPFFSHPLQHHSWKGHTSQLIVSGSDSTAVLRALHPVTTYHLRVIAENAIGKSRPSGIINVTTQVEAPSGPPRELTVHPTGDQSLKVTWKVSSYF